LRLGLVLAALTAAMVTSACLGWLPTQPSKKDIAGDQKREAAYQATMKSYSEALKPGTTRREVEDYLRARQTTFGRWGGTLKDPAQTDVITIGKLWKPWFCSEHNVYIKFHFSRLNQHADPTQGVLDSDVLTNIEREDRLEGCL